MSLSVVDGRVRLGHQQAPGSSLVLESFEHSREGKVDKAEALRQAQLAVMRQGMDAGNGTINYSDPFCWAAFVLIGEWK